ncbi:DUF6368 family protein [Streptomyces sp. NPDC058086]|uniref:DUF6368 family protein n=1 Tax=Streptomyces sp. NPDC058086 TaxID=3346334 RepID=UPI0036EB8D4C
MGGPAAGLWLPGRRSALDAAPWLESFCEVRIENDDSLEFSVRQPSAIGLHGLQQTSPGSFHLGPESLEDYQELGFPGLDRPPAAELALLAYSSGQENHLLLGHLAQFLAERFAALIDLGGLLGYRFCVHGTSRGEEENLLAEARALASSLPGRVWEMPYAAHGGGCGYSHVGDLEFLAAWLDHPNFRMIK